MSAIDSNITAESLIGEVLSTELTDCLHTGLKVKQGIDELRISNTEGWTDRAMEIIRQSRYQDPKKELVRLVGSGVINESFNERVTQVVTRVIPTLDKILPHIRKIIFRTLLTGELFKLILLRKIPNIFLNKMFYKNLVTILKIFMTTYVMEFMERIYHLYINRAKTKNIVRTITRILAQAEEIKSVFNRSHYVFFHGQSLPFYPLIILYKQQAKRTKPELVTRNFQYLRSPSLQDENCSLSPYTTNRHINDLNELERRDLLSCSADLFDDDDCDSALSFTLQNTNILNNSSDKVLNKLLGTCESVRRKIMDKIPDKIDGCPPPGNLIVICIPKEKLDDLAYKAHPFGRACDCAEFGRNPQMYLEGWQNNRHEGGCAKSSQYRVLLPKLTRESGGRIFICSPLRKETRVAIKKAVIDSITQSPEHGEVGTTNLADESAPEETPPDFDPFFC
jgi:hypothetical protein